ncbi:MAG: hypothetical protein AABW92_00585, partial [Nanoarchaeota archaeon]
MICYSYINFDFEKHDYNERKKILNNIFLDMMKKEDFSIKKEGDNNLVLWHKFNLPDYADYISKMQREFEYPSHIGVSVNEYLAKLAMIHSHIWDENPLVLSMEDVVKKLYNEPFIPGILPGIKKKVREGVISYYGKNDLNIGDF